MKWIQPSHPMTQSKLPQCSPNENNIKDPEYIKRHAISVITRSNEPKVERATLNDLNHKDKLKLKMMAKRLACLEKIIATEKGYPQTEEYIQIRNDLLQKPTMETLEKSVQVEVECTVGMESIGTQSEELSKEILVDDKVLKRVRKQKKHLTRLETGHHELSNQLLMFEKRLLALEGRDLEVSNELKQINQNQKRIFEQIDDLEGVVSSLNKFYHDDQHKQKEQSMLFNVDETMKSTGYHRLVDQILTDIERAKLSNSIIVKQDDASDDHDEQESAPPLVVKVDAFTATEGNQSEDETKEDVPVTLESSSTDWELNEIISSLNQRKRSQFHV